MAESFCISDRRLLAWNPDKDRFQWLARLEEFGGQTVAAALHFATEINDNLTAFIAELRPGQEQQLLRSYSYQLRQIDSAVVNRVVETRGIASVEDRSLAIAQGIKSAHEFFRSAIDETQAVLMSPVNEIAGKPEHQHTAVYWLTHRNGAVKGWQLFLNITSVQRQELMRNLSNNQGQEYGWKNDLDLAAHPALIDNQWQRPEDFIEAAFRFLGVDVDPAGFVGRQLKLEERNQEEAGIWVDKYINAITQGLLGTASQIITQMQLKVRGLTEFDVRQAQRQSAVEVSPALQVFLAACGFLEFSFASSVSGQEAVLSINGVGSGGCEAKICRRCGTHAGDHDTKCKHCGWKPGN
ncbi:hypothetical protein HZB78_05905 [Candidatus Collierbacteria bacterium]|nr:hypothetical protein [Candidatus Collierbacteria bacterium]